ncbi:hypothetical protein AB0B63_07205 [Micromonospora sp. NPDC049081]|uniref:hypothetical protein n=1 Tax=Micromonospora sp. NPDC049081 TaxID=3155150 RepID=UPI003402320A
MPLRRLPARCWVLVVDHCGGEPTDIHRYEVTDFFTPIAEVWARWPERIPPVPFLHEAGCVLVECRVCGLAVGDGEHFADAEHAWEGAECDGWQGDVCPFCQPVEVEP